MRANPAIHTAAIGWKEWGIILTAGAGLLILEEAKKHFFPRLFS